MKVKRFVAASVKAALVLVKERLGADAVILSNRSIPEGVEVLAIAEADMTDMAVAPDAAALAQAEPPPGFTASFKRDTTSKASISPELADFFDAPDTAVNKPSSTATADLRSPLPKLVARSATPESTVVVRTPVVHTPVVHTPIVRPPIVRTPVARTLEPRAVRTPAWSERNHQTRELNAIPPSPNFDGPIAADELPQHFVSRNATVRSFNFAELLNKPFEQEKPVPRSSGAATTARPPVQRAVQNDGLHAAPRGVQPTPPSAGSNRAGLQGGHSAGAMESNVATVASPDMMAELRALRGFIEERLAFAGWSDELRRRPVASTLMRELLAAGFSTALARAATSALPEALDAKEARS